MSISANSISAENAAEEFHQNGFVKLSGLFSAQEVHAWKDECDRLINLEIVSPENLRTPYKNPAIPFPEKIDPVVDISPLFKTLSQDERIVGVVHTIFQDSPLLFKDKLIYKLPSMNGYGLHQDWAWGWQHLASAEDLLSVSLQIDAATKDNGCIELFEGYHDRLRTAEGEERNFNEEERKQIDHAKAHLMETMPGDLLIFHSLTPHQSGRNHTTYPRRSLYLTYNAERAGSLREAYYKHYMDNIVGKQMPRHFV
jgi:ectoine hydroxylase-related dioxygenase (phytanoyl-CoA dioxygenase family)